MTATALPGQPHIAYSGDTLCMEGVKLQDVAAQFGTPVFAYSKAAMLSALAAYQRGFAGRKAQICYAMKANSNLAVLKFLHKPAVALTLCLAVNWRACWQRAAHPTKLFSRVLAKHVQK